MTKVWDDGASTYFEFSQSLQPVSVYFVEWAPISTRFNRSAYTKTPTPLDHRWENNILVVERLGEQFVIDHAGHRVSVVRTHKN